MFVLLSLTVLQVLIFIQVAFIDISILFTTSFINNIATGVRKLLPVFYQILALELPLESLLNLRA